MSKTSDHPLGPLRQGTAAEPEHLVLDDTPAPMPPRAPSKERVEELKGRFQYQKDIIDTVKGNPALGRVMLLDIRDYDDLLVIIDDYSALKAKNERLKKATVELGIQAAENLSQAEKAEAQLEKVKADLSDALKIGYDQQADLEKFRPLVEAVGKARLSTLTTDHIFWSVDEEAILRAALKLRSEK